MGCYMCDSQESTGLSAIVEEEEEDNEDDDDDDDDDDDRTFCIVGSNS